MCSKPRVTHLSEAGVLHEHGGQRLLGGFPGQEVPAPRQIQCCGAVAAALGGVADGGRVAAALRRVDEGLHRLEHQRPQLPATPQFGVIRPCAACLPATSRLAENHSNIRAKWRVA